MNQKMTIKELWQRHHEIGLDGWISSDEGEAIRKEVERLDPGEVYLEIGVAYGKSLSTAAYYADEGVGIFGIDRLNWAPERTKALKNLGVDGRVNFIEGESQWEALSWEHGEISLLFIDGDHTYYGVIKDLLSWLPHVRPGGRIMLHDYTRSSPGVMRAVNEFIEGHDRYENIEVTGSIYAFTKI